MTISTPVKTRVFEATASCAEETVTVICGDFGQAQMFFTSFDLTHGLRDGHDVRRFLKSYIVENFPRNVNFRPFPEV